MSDFPFHRGMKQTLKANDMDSPKPGTKLMAGFEQMILQGDHIRFFKALDGLDSSHEEWGILQVRSIELYMEAGFFTKALDKSLLLKNSLIDPSTRKQAELLHLYLNLLLNGEDEVQETNLFQLCETLLRQPKESTLDLLAKSICLRLSANQLMTGMADANLKDEIVARYVHFIETCLQNGAEQRAFSCIIELAQLLISKPSPCLEKALNHLKRYKKKNLVQKAPHRKAPIYRFMAELKLEQHLSGNKNSQYLRYYKLALEAYEEVEHKFTREIIDQSYGRLLLKFGKGQGKKLLDRAIRGFEKKGATRQSFEAHSTVLHWLEKKGDLVAIKSYQTRINEIREETGYFVKAPKVMRQEQDNLLSMSINLMSLANEMKSFGKYPEAILLIQKVLPKFERQGETLHLAHILKYLSELTDSPATALSKATSQRAITLYNRLGYNTEAIEVLKNRVIRWAEQTDLTSLNSEEIKQAQQDIQLLLLRCESITDLASQEALIASHQAIAYFYVKSRSTRLALKYIEQARHSLNTHGLTLGLAHNTFYRGCILMEIASLNNADEMHMQAVEYFHQAYQLFRLLNNREGVWRSQFGIALSTQKALLLNLKKSTLLLKTCIDHYNRAIETVHRSTRYHVKTLPHFGVSFLFNTYLQRDAKTLFTSAIDFFTHVAYDSDQASRLMHRKNSWVMLNNERPELNPN